MNNLSLLINIIVSVGANPAPENKINQTNAITKDQKCLRINERRKNIAASLLRQSYIKRVISPILFVPLAG